MNADGRGDPSPADKQNEHHGDALVKLGVCKKTIRINELRVCCWYTLNAKHLFSQTFFGAETAECVKGNSPKFLHLRSREGFTVHLEGGGR